MKEKDLVMCILLSIVTCGLYGLYWLACLTEDSYALSGDTGPSGVLVVILTVITCGIYGWYWGYKMGERLDRVLENLDPRNERKGISSAIYLVLCFFGLDLIAWTLMQNQCNKAIASYER